MTKQLKLKKLIYGLTWMLLTWISAQPCTAEVLSLSDAVNAALLHNPRLKAARYGVLASEEKIIQTGSGTCPVIQLSEQAGHTTNPMWAFGTRLNQQSITAVDFAPDRLNDPDGITNYVTAVSINWPLYDSGKTWYGIQQARLAKESAGLFEQRIKQVIMAGTITAYIQVLLSRENQTVLQRMLETAVSHMKLIRSRYDGGLVTKSDLLRAKVRIADLKQQLSQAKSETGIAGCNLNIVMGMNSNLQYRLTSPLDPGEKFSGTLDEWICTALSHRPDLKQAERQKQILEKEVEKAGALRHPSVSLMGNYEINTENFAGTASNYTVGALISVPLYSGGRISSKIREAVINLKQNQAVVTSIRQQICCETRKAYFDAQSAWDRIQVTQAAIGQSEESLRIIKNRYQGGLFTITDLLDAQVLLQQSLTLYRKTVHDYMAAVTRLALAAGTLSDKSDIKKRHP